ncbi:unnamed protein product [Pylaiella littoralis]
MDVAPDVVDEESLVTIPLSVPPPSRDGRSSSSSLAGKHSGGRGISLSYRVSLTVEVKGFSETGKAAGGTKTKLILDDACGTVAPGQMLAIMGPSGAGKTSLLNCLSLRNKAYRGTVLHNGKAPDMDTVGITTAFVQQEDLFIPTLTPREHLRFHANMRMDASMPKEEKMKAVENALEGLGLGKCAETPIGGQGSQIRGISGGEKKRLSFATEVLGDASVIFVDEPTSGLDSFMAEAVVTKLKELAEAGRTIIGTIHQPSSQVFSLFSHLHLLAEGKTVFCGPLDRAMGHFEAIGHPCPSFYNPADHYIRVMSRDPASPEASERRIAAAAESYRQSGAYVQVQAILPGAAATDPQEEKTGGGERDKSEAAATTGANAKHASHKVYQASWSTQVAEVYKRTLIMYRREPVLTKVRLGQTIVVALLVGLIFLQLGNSQSDVQSTMGVLFFVAINQGIVGTIGVLQVFPNEMPVFLREHDSGSYRVGSYFLGRTLAELPIQIIFPALFSVIVYLLCGFPLEAKAFFLFIVFVVVTSNAAISLGYVVSALAKNVDVALGLGLMVLLPLIIFGGLFINLDEIPAYFLWYSVFSFVQYGYKGVSIAIWETKETLDCPPAPALCAFPTGQSVLDYLQIEGGNRQLWLNFIYLMALMIGFRLLAYLALIYRSRPTGARAY